MRLLRPAAAFAALALCACSKPDSTRPNATASASATASAPPLAPPPPAQGKPGCRAIDVIGRVAAGGVPLASNALLDGEHWLELEAGASVSLRHTQTTREFKLIGPARVLPCRAGSEQLLLAKGQLTTSANLGVRPGAEVLIATPQGTVRYGDAALDLELGEKGLRLRVKQGEAWLEPEAQGKPRFKNPVRSGAEARLAPHPTLARDLVATCQAAAELASQSAQRVLEHSPTADAGAGSLGERAAAHMQSRGKARVACAIAAAAVGALEPNLGHEASERQSLSAAVAHADELWQSVPRPISGRKN